MPYAKAIAAALAAVLAAVVPAFYTGSPLGFSGWVNVVILAAGALQVYNAANLPAAGWRYGKLVAACVSAGAVVLSSALVDGVTLGEWIQVATAVLGAFTVWRVPNAAAEPVAPVVPIERPGRHERTDDAIG